ncbi:S-layer family protein [Natranaerovirga pectinivora]|uniref:S-layer family protein n=1 Tax=Natranaerovirga pectinivora TaxID=682400 RepID=A0A4R3MR52_9FIRM|nr:S-layer homology domain-containing protein [Natranaerovirga pectinivora]TCT15058.1 S-layer family protein [Natranaerovirga pectinivora]
MVLHNYSFKATNNQIQLILELDNSLYEFANEFNKLKPDKESIQVLIKKINKLYPNIKFTAINIMIGSLLVASIPIYSQQAQSTNLPIVNEVKQETNRFNMTYLYFGSMTTQYNSVTKAKDTLQVISPSYFDIDKNGKLMLNHNQLNTNFINAMKAHNIRVVPFLSNHFDRVAGQLALQDYIGLANELAYYIEFYNLDGINVDIENINHTEKNQFTNFIKYLREIVPEHKEVSVAVPANPKGWTLGWHGAYDYTALAEYADYLMIMAYDEHYFSSKPGPVASYSFVEDSIKYALKYAPKEKIVLGLPFYGRYWLNGGATGGHGLHLTQVERLKDLYPHKVYYDHHFKSPMVEITVRQTDPVTNIHGRPLAPGTYTIWYENDDSIKSKLSLVQKYDLKGTGSWSLGQENNHIWSFYNLWLNGTYFSDIDTTWAKDAILEIANRNWMVGLGETRFEPKSNLTRGQAATLLTNILNLQVEKNLNSNFNDINNHWAKDYINTVSKHNIMIGYDNGNFNPDQVLTREEMSMLLFRILSLDDNTVSNAVFSDVENTRWSFDAIQRLASSGVVQGYGDNTFRPAQPIKRDEMASLLFRISDEIEQLSLSD